MIRIDSSVLFVDAAILSFSGPACACHLANRTTHGSGDRNGEHGFQLGAYDQGEALESGSNRLSLDPTHYPYFGEVYITMINPRGCLSIKHSDSVKIILISDDLLS